MMIRLIPKIFYARMEDGLELFVDCLSFTVLHHDETLAVIEREGAKAYLVEDPEFAAKDRPEITLETDTIDALYAEVAPKHPEMLHPNSNVVQVRPWGAREFAIRDKTQVCVVFRQWQAK
jgi:hypothetical protein